MANEIKRKLGTSAAITIALESLATSTAGVGRQGTIIDNTTTLWGTVHIQVRVRLGTSPTANKGVYVYFIRDDNNGHRTDGAGTTDAGLTVVNAELVGVGKSVGTTGEDVYVDAVVYDPGLKWTIAVVHDTGVTTNSTAANSYAVWYGSNPEVQ